ncbi:nitrate reductase [Alteromonas aestuariivivens]|uniref:Nitrate reductase n=1 Tax=Alteromonas aestuariivivens TaxID=1938339 RepID=A0A3D8MCQ7_9ALTE|nr:nitrate reductase [Alteromonas aestuariivivens]RDV28020.1 nitrate reductase [Alteromonas aestuariivivens]
MNHNKLNTPLSLVAQPPVRSLGQTTCPYCGVGCGVDISCNGSGRSISLESLTGTPEHPANFGRLCVKGTHLLDTNDTTQRLLYPQLNGERVDWDQATDFVADKIRQVVAEHGPDAVAFYVSGQLLTEDYYVANKLMKGFIGSANIDTNSRLCMSSAVAAYKRAFGEDLVPCNYEDLEQTDLLVLVGSNAAWTHPVLFQRMERARLRNPALKVVVIDPRQTETCALADWHLAIKPGSDVALFNGLLRYLGDHQALDADFIETATEGFAATLAACMPWDLESVASCCGLSVAEVESFYRRFAQSPSAVTFFSMGVNQSTSGTDKANAIINCHLASGKIGKPGSGPFSITGQPNAMGGREVGGLANMLAAHMDIENPVHRERVQTFWNAPTVAEKGGYKAVDLFQAIDEGKVKFVWIMATNPVVSMPNRAQVERALARCDTVVVSDIVTHNDTLKFAHVALPASGWSEKNGTVTNSERRISRQRGLLPPPGEARHDWQIICEVAAKLGFAEAFDYASPAQIFDEHACLTAWQNNGERALNLSGLAGLSPQQYDRLKPVQWPVTESTPQGCARLFENKRFFTASRKAQFIALEVLSPRQLTSAAYPYVLNSGRMRDQWHTMTRTGKTSKLLQHTAQAQLAIHPQDSLALGVVSNELVTLKAHCSGNAPVILPVKIDPRQRRGEVFAPIHWSATWGSHCTLGQLFDGSHDPVSGQPELKHGAIRIAPAEFDCHGQLACSDKGLFELLLAECDYWSRVPATHVSTARIAANISAVELCRQLAMLLPKAYCQISFQQGSSVTLLVLKDDHPVLYLSLHHKYTNLPLDWLDSVFDPDGELSFEVQASLLRNQVEASFLQGKLVCSCFNVREKPILAEIAGGADSVEELGKRLKCGTNCGSCRSELSSMLTDSGAASEQSPLLIEGALS